MSYESASPPLCLLHCTVLWSGGLRAVVDLELERPAVRESADDDHLAVAGRAAPAEDLLPRRRVEGRLRRARGQDVDVRLVLPATAHPEAPDVVPAGARVNADLVREGGAALEVLPQSQRVQLLQTLSLAVQSIGKPASS